MISPMMENIVLKNPVTNKFKPKPILRKRRYNKRPISASRGNKLNLGETEAPPKAKPKQHLKFAGPIKIIVIEPKSEYCKTVWCAVGIGLSNIAIGAVLMTVLHYTLKTGDAHAILCSIAYHFFSAEAILALHYANGWSTPMRMRHKKFAHIFLNCCGIILAIAGTVLIAVDKGITAQPHGLTGIITAVLVILSAIIGPFAYVKKKTWLLMLHLSFAIPAFIMSSLCICFGLFVKAFKDWTADGVVFILVAFIIFYTVFIVTSAFMKCMSRI